MTSSRRSRGFTLIELMVVMSIISLLSSIVISSTSSAKTKAQDAFALEEINQLKNAITSFNLDTHAYPLAILGVSIRNNGVNPSGAFMKQDLDGSFGTTSYIPQNFDTMPLHMSYIHLCGAPTDTVAGPENCTDPAMVAQNLQYLSACVSSPAPQAAIMFQLQSGVSSQYPVSTINPTYNLICFY